MKIFKYPLTIGLISLFVIIAVMALMDVGHRPSIEYCQKVHSLIDMLKVIVFFAVVCSLGILSGIEINGNKFK